MTHGKWMPGKKHSQTCSFIDKVKCCKKKQNRHFEFHDQQLNTINAVKELRKILKNKTLLLLVNNPEVIMIQMETQNCFAIHSNCQ